MSDTVKLIIAIPREMHEALLKTERIISSQRSGKTLMNVIYSAVAKATPLDSVKVEIEEYKSTIDRAISEDELKIEGMKEAYTDCLKILDNIGKESEEE